MGKHVNCGIDCDSESEVAAVRFYSDVDDELTLRLGADQLLSLIQRLGAARAQLVKGKKTPDLKGASVKAVRTAKWLTQPDLKSGGSLIAFQHPEFGPIAFVIPQVQVKKLIRLLSNQAKFSFRSSGTPN